jgi:hypothetical protein
MGRALLGLVRPSRTATFEGKTRKILPEHICMEEGAAYGGVPVATLATLLDTTQQAIWAIVFGDVYTDGSGRPRFHAILDNNRGRGPVIQPAFEHNRGVRTKQKRRENLLPWE